MARTNSNRILERKTDFKPEFKVFIQEITAAGSETIRGTAFVREIGGFNTVSVGHTLSGVPTANVILSNIHDRYFRRKQARQFPAVEGTSTADYIRKVIGSLQPEQTEEVNPKRRANAFEEVAEPIGGRSKRRVEDYVGFRYDLGTEITLSSELNRKEGLIKFGLMSRVFIDVKGRDGLWYAGFSGIISALSDIYTAGAEMSLQLTCMGTSRLLEVAEIYTTTALDQLEQTIASQAILEQRRELYKSMEFSGMEGTEILRRVIRNTQVMNCFDAQTDIAAEGFKQTQLPREEYFYQERFWEIDTSRYEVGNYLGIGPLRTVQLFETTQGLDAEGKVVEIKPVFREPGLGIVDGDPVAALRGKLFLDEHIFKGPQAEAFQYLIRGQFDLFQSQKMFAYQIVRKVADLTFWDFFEDPNGNLIYQIPKYNNFPGEMSNQEASKIYGFDPGAVSYTETTEAGELRLVQENGQVVGENVTSLIIAQEGNPRDFSPLPELFRETEHGLNYLITNGGGLNQWSLNENEHELVTYVDAPAGANLLSQVSEVLQWYASTGRTNQDEIRRLQRRFGLRAVTLQQMFLGKSWGAHTTRINVLDAFALAALQSINARSKVGQVSLLARPDLMVGKTVWLVERQKLYYVVGVNHNLTRVGDQYNTVLTLAYGHDLAERVTQPWVEVRGKILTKSADEENEARAQQTQQVLQERRVVLSTEPPIPAGLTERERVFGSFGDNFTDAGNGVITITDENFLEEIVDITIQGIPPGSSITFPAHRKLEGRLKQIFQSIAARPELARKIDHVSGFRGSKVNFSPTGKLSNHCWGIAFDIIFVNSVASKTKGAVRPICRDLAPFFKKMGFKWGGEFRDVDDNHFQLEDFFMAEAPSGDRDKE